MDNIVNLYTDLVNKNYKHGKYHAFNISDPKPRNIHKASVRDRLLHHAIYKVLYPYFDSRFIHDSYSCRQSKGTHKAICRFKQNFWKVSKNNTRTCWVLKCDIKKFFASIDHTILLNILSTYDIDAETLQLLKVVVKSFDSGVVGKGLPLGNLTSQLLVNIYMNKFDQFIKHELKCRFYIRYADDFVFLSDNKNYLFSTLQIANKFLEEKLKLNLHPNKVFTKTFTSGIDFLGWIHFFDHKVIRPATKRRMIKRIKHNQKAQTVSSYRGLLSHGNTHKLNNKVFSEYK
jgi:retron-type reverse transcriptase